jgi:hypothetical protein
MYTLVLSCFKKKCDVDILIYKPGHLLDVRFLLLSGKWVEVTLKLAHKAILVWRVQMVKNKSENVCVVVTIIRMLTLPEGIWADELLSCAG